MNTSFLLSFRCVCVCVCFNPAGPDIPDNGITHDQNSRCLWSSSRRRVPPTIMHQWMGVSQLASSDLAESGHCLLQQPTSCGWGFLMGSGMLIRSWSGVTGRLAEKGFSCLVCQINFAGWSGRAADRKGGQPAGSGCSGKGGEFRFFRTLNLFPNCGTLDPRLWDGWSWANLDLIRQT